MFGFQKKKNILLLETLLPNINLKYFLHFDYCGIKIEYSPSE